ncbi:hypothetical protein DIJ62_16000 [Burkholderia pseudomallei]|nr:hypothetical protein DIJ62_16000 [Burkholderia pseudomallei]
MRPARGGGRGLPSVSGSARVDRRAHSVASLRAAIADRAPRGAKPSRIEAAARVSFDASHHHRAAAARRAPPRYP